MRLSIVLILLIPMVPADTEKLIAEYHALKESEVEERLAVVEKLGADPSDKADEFLKYILDNARAPEVRTEAPG